MEKEHQENKPFVLRSVLHGNYLRDLLSDHYNMGDWLECKYLLRGLNDTYKVTTSTGSYILRLYRAEVSEQRVEQEMYLIESLSTLLTKGITKAAEAVVNQNHEWYCSVHAPEGTRYAVLFRNADGVEPALHDEASCYLFGISAAELHDAMDRIASSPVTRRLDLDFLIQQPIRSIIRYIGVEHPQTLFLTTFADRLMYQVKSRLEQGLDWGMIHGDMHGNNNVQYNGEHFSHIDFEWSGLGWRAYDLAQVWLSRRKHHSTDQAELLWNEILKGYRSIRPLSANDEHAISDFAMVRRLWVMSLDAAFIDSDSGSLDFGEDWIHAFVQEFQQYLQGLEHLNVERK